jgi:hypothetical protein
MKNLMKVTSVLFLLSLCASAISQSIPIPDGGCTNCPPYTNNFMPTSYFPGLKLAIQPASGTNLYLNLLEADPAGKYDIYYESNLNAISWSDVLQGTNGQTNFILTFPQWSDSGFFKVSRTDTPVVNTAGMTVSFPNSDVNTNLTSAIICGGPAAMMAVLVGDTNLADAIWIPFSAVPYVLLGTNDGTYQVEFGLVGSDGQTNWVSDSVTLDTTPPLLVITNPVFSTTSKPILQLQGYSTEPLSSIYFDIANAAGSLTNEQGFVTSQFFDTNAFASTTNYFQCFDIPLTNGVNIITVHATDIAGNITITNVAINLDFSEDTNPPNISLIWPQNGTHISGTSFTLRGVLDDETAQVFANLIDSNGITNSIEGTVERNGTFWLEDLPLNLGTNHIAIIAIDAAGNISMTNFMLIQSQVILTINPIPTDQLNLPATIMTGIVSDASYNVSVNGVQATVDGSGNWSACGVPIYGNGTATFDAIAYSDGQPPVQTSLAIEQPSIIYISDYTDSWTENEEGYGHWTNTKNYNAQVDNNGHYSFMGSATGNGTFAPSLEWWWIINYNWSDSDPTGTSTETEDEQGYTETASAAGINPLEGYFYIPDGNSVPSVSSSGIVHYYANVNYSWDEDPYTTYLRNSTTHLKLKTGGKAIITKKSLFQISANATEYGKPDLISWGNGPDVWFNTPANSINSTQIRVLGKNIGSDGNLYTVLPNNATLDLNASAPARDYNMNISATKYKLTITANGNDLESTTPEFCVGQGITFLASWYPADPGAVNTIAYWHLPGDYVNESYAYSSTCNSYRLNADLLANLSMSCWYVDTPGGTASFGISMQFSNGQTASVATHGDFTLVKPTIDHITSSCSGVNMFTNSDGSLNEIALIDTNHGNGMQITVYVKRPDDFSGLASITQLIKRQLNWNTPPLGISSSDSTSGNFWLDTQETYSSIYFPLTENGNPTNPVRPVYLADSPGLGESFLGFYNYAEAQDDFHDYVRFQPDGGIPITIGRVDWGWHGKAIKNGSLWSLVTATYYGATLDSADDSFPIWPYTYTGTPGN